MKDFGFSAEMPDDTREIIGLTITYTSSKGIESSTRVFPEYKVWSKLIITSQELSLEDAKTRL